jgi:flavin-dependent dehydrogenase
VKPGATFLRGDLRERYGFAEMFPGQRTSTYQVPRGDFDQLLSTQARRAGADVRVLHRVDTVDATASGVTVRATDLESNAPLEVRARFVIDCSGYGRVLPRLFKLEKASPIVPRAAIFTMVEGDRRPTGADEGDIWVAIHPRGVWVWVIPFSDGRTSVGVVGDKALLESAGANDRDRLFHLLEEDPNLWQRLSAARPVLKVMRLEAWSCSVDRFHGPGWAVAGNASEFLDPVFSSGVTLAMESANLAAQLAHRQLSGETVDWDRDYEKVVRHAVGVFKAFVLSWYADDLPRILLHRDKGPDIKRAITSVLGGYVLDTKNPFVRDAEGTLQALLRMIGPSSRPQTPAPANPEGR